MRNMKEVWASLSPEQKKATPRREKGHRFSRAPASVEAPAEMAGLEITGTNPDNPRVEAPCCKRQRPLDYLVDLRPMPAGIRRQALADAGVVNPRAEIVCSSCLERLRRTGVMNWSEVSRHAGSPQSTVRRFEEVEEHRKNKYKR